jgi:hypothetical protein
VSQFDGIYGGLHEGGVHKDGSKRHTVETVGPKVAKYDNIAGLVGEVETVMFVTSSEWARLADEIQILTKQVNPDNFRRLRLRNLTVVNSGSEDQEAVNILNIPEARKCDFQNRRQRLISGRIL